MIMDPSTLECIFLQEEPGGWSHATIRREIRTYEWRPLDPSGTNVPCGYGVQRHIRNEDMGERETNIHPVHFHFHSRLTPL